MLQALREQASSWVIKILLGFLILSFAVWGINDIFLGERDPAVAEVDGTKVTRSQVEERLRPLFGGRLDREEAARMGLVRQVIDNAVTRTVVRVGTRDLGIVVSDDMVRRHIRSDETFFNARNRFDRNLFRQALAREGISEAYYVASLKRELAAAHLDRAVTARVPVPDAMVEPLTRYLAESRVARSVLVPDAAEDAVPEPRSAELRAFYDSHSARFMAPEYRDITFVHLDPLAMAGEVRVSEERLEEAYGERIDEFTIRDRRRVDQAVFRSREAAERARRAVENGASLEKAARTAGEGTVEVVSLGWVEKEDLFGALADPVFALPENTVSEPIRTGLGWHLLRVRDTQEGRVKPLSEVRDELRREIAAREAADGLFALANRLEDALAGGATLREAASQIGTTARHVPRIDSRGRGPDGEPVGNLPKGGDFLRTVFDTEEGERSRLTETETGGFFIVEVNRVIEPQVRPLTEVRDEVAAAWRAEKRSEAAKKRAERMVGRLRAGATLEDVAGKAGLEVRTSPPFTRLTHDVESGLPAALMEKLFTLRPGEAAMAEADKGVVVAVLTDIRPPSEKEREETSAAITEELRRGLSDDLFQQFVGALRQRYDIEIHPEVLGTRG